MKFFRETTLNHTVVMGGNTLRSFPNGKPLKNRVNIVLSRGQVCDECIFVRNYDALNKELKARENEEIFIIGGGTIYKELLPLCDRVYVTKIYKKHENVDTYFPNLDETDDWTTTPIAEPENYKDFSYQFWRYDRKS